MPKVGANWSKIEPGDVISFKYQSVVDKSKQPKTSTILVLNTRFQKKLKSGDTDYYLNGLKLEGSNITVFTNKEEAWTLLTEVGDLEVISLKDEIYKVNIHPRYIGTWGATEKLYRMIQKTPAGKKAQFRTYNWDQAKKSAVFYEPIKLPKDRVQLLIEEQGG